MNVEGSTLRVLPKKKDKDEIYAQLAPGKGKKKQQVEGDCKQTRAVTLAEFHRNQEEKAKRRDSPLPPPQVVVPTKPANMPSRPPPPALAGEKGKGKMVDAKGKGKAMATEETEFATKSRIRTTSTIKEGVSVSYAQKLKNVPASYIYLVEQLLQLKPNLWCGNRVSKFYRDLIFNAMLFFAYNWNKFGYLKKRITYHPQWATIAFARDPEKDAKYKDLPKYIYEFTSLIDDMLEPTALHQSALLKARYRHFRAKLHLAIVNNDLDQFKQLKNHPLFLCTREKAHIIECAPSVFKRSCSETGRIYWQSLYKNIFPNPSRIYEKITIHEQGFFQMLYEPPKGMENQSLGGRYYEPNGLGSLRYSRNLLSHINKHFRDPGKPPSKREIRENLNLILRKAPTETEIIKKLEDFFPTMMEDLYDFCTMLKIDMGNFRIWDKAEDSDDDSLS